MGWGPGPLPTAAHPRGLELPVVPVWAQSVVGGGGSRGNGHFSGNFIQFLYLSAHLFLSVDPVPLLIRCDSRGAQSTDRRLGTSHLPRAFQLWREPCCLRAFLCSICVIS